MEKEVQERDGALNTLESYQEFNEPLPEGMHPEEAGQRLNTNKDIIIHELEKDSNAYHLDYIKTCGITPEDLIGKIKDSKGCIHDEVLQSWYTCQKRSYTRSIPREIPHGCIEVYIWGLPGSGKTCFISTILCVLKALSNVSGSHFADIIDGISKCKDFFQVDYDTSVMVLPPSFPQDEIQWFPSSICVKKGKKTVKHQLAIVNVPGDIFNIFRDKSELKPLKSDQKSLVDQLMLYLNSRNNPKYHFFLLDNKPLDINKWLDFDGAGYIRDEKIFNRNTIGISLIVTKCDQLSPDDWAWERMSEDIVHSHYYHFVTELKKIVGNPCKGGLGLSDDSIAIIPFSIGEVFFQQLCIFNPEPTKRLVEMMEKIILTFSESFLQRIIHRIIR